MCSLLAAGFCGRVIAEPARENATAEEPTLGQAPPTTDQIAHWIQQLGDDSYAVRQTAAERLLSGGQVARQALVEWTDAPDPEIRAAARRLVALIEQTEFDRQLAEFIADVEGNRGVTLPGWPEFSALVGSDPAARQMFADMHRCEAELLADVFRDRAAEPEVNWTQRLAEIQQWQRVGRQRNISPPLATCATILFLGCVEDFAGTGQIANHVAELASQPPIREAVHSEDQSNAIIRRLLLAWINGCPVHSQHVLQSRLTLIITYQLSEALPVAVAVARGEPPYLTANIANRAIAVLAVGRFGSAENVDDLEALLADDTVWKSANHLGNNRQIQLRDVALATMLHLTDQPLQDYGFDSVQRNPQLLFNPQSLGMADDETRAAAIAKWRAWRAENAGVGN